MLSPVAIRDDLNSMDFILPLLVVLGPKPQCCYPIAIRESIRTVFDPYVLRIDSMLVDPRNLRLVESWLAAKYHIRFFPLNLNPFCLRISL